MDEITSIAIGNKDVFFEIILKIKKLIGTTKEIKEGQKFFIHDILIHNTM